ncbi:accessory gene regulator ArgB-like protein [Wukongibacter sp. M2B1]|uniref:accessory gene regulator ArgB-like protein n=1 Tax=Wukongibacter sp. M2B1 TaxID=3088895 RepID=UPI003D7BDBCF
MKKFGVEALTDSTIDYFKKNTEIDNNQEAILRFAIEVVISFVVSLGLALLVALLLGIFPNVLIIILTTSILRSFSGGSHSETMLGCSLYGTIIMNGFGLLTKYTQPSKGLLSIIVLLILMFSTWSFYKYAPADTPGKPINTKVKRQKLRKFSFATLFIWCTLCLLWYTGLMKSLTIIYASSLGVLWQSFSLTDWGYALLHHMDRALRMINKKEEELI